MFLSTPKSPMNSRYTLPYIYSHCFNLLNCFSTPVVNTVFSSILQTATKFIFLKSTMTIMPQKVTVASRCLMQSLSSWPQSTSTDLPSTTSTSSPCAPTTEALCHQFTHRDDPLHQKQASILCFKKKDQITNT